MTTVAHHREPPATISTRSAALATTQDSTREEADLERRWQLEWDRRNVED